MLYLAPTLASLATNEIRVFLREYDRYNVLRMRDKKAVLTLIECTEERVLDQLKLRHKEVLTTDDKFREYLKSLSVYTSPEEFIMALEGISMDMSVGDVNERLAEYERNFLQVQKQSNLVLKDKTLLDAYVAGIRPDGARAEIESYMDVKDVNFEKILKITEEIVIKHESVYKANKRAGEKRGTNPAKSKAEKPKTWHGTMSSGSTGAGPSKSGSEDHSLCRHCHNEKWSPAHAAVCPVLKKKRAERYESSQSNNIATNDNAKGKSGGNMCRRCGKVPWTYEHYQTCRNTPRQGGVKQEPATVSTVEAKNESKPKKNIKVPVEVANSVLEATLDTGAATSCVSEAMLKRIMMLTAVEVMPSGENSRVEVADGRIVNVNRVSFVLKVPTRGGISQSVELRWRFEVLPGKKDMLLLGCDIQREVGLIDDESVYVPLNLMKFYSEKDKEEALNKEAADEVNDEVLKVESVEDQECHLVVCKQDEGKEEEEARKKAVRPIDRVKIVEGDMRADVYKLLLKHEKAFEENLPVDGCSMDHFKIATTEDVCFNDPPRRVPNYDLRIKLKKHVEELRLAGVIVRADRVSGSCTSPIVIVTKANGEIRLCVDFRKLNASTKFFDYQLPNIVKILQYTAGMEYFGTADMLMGYHQCILDHGSRKYTGFMVPGEEDGWVRYEYLRLPFGVMNGPTFYQSQMEKTFSELLYTILIVFIDDILVYGKTKDKFLINLDKMLTCVEKNDLRLKAVKCVFGAKEVRCIGYVISKMGRRIAEERVMALKNLPPPKNVPDLRAFAGVVNSMRDFIPECSLLMAPLNRLLKKGTTYVWNQEQQECYDKIKNVLTSDLILAQGTEDGELILRTDASGVGIGGALWLRQPDGQEKPVSYFSQTLTDTQRRWSTYEQELYGIVYCMTRDPYAALLKLRPFVVETDHRNLVWLEQTASTNRKLSRWRTLMMEFTFKVVHIPGQTNHVADVLSRQGHARGIEDLPPVEVCLLSLNNTDVNELRDEVKKAQGAAIAQNKEWAATLRLDETTGLYTDEAGLINIPDNAADLKHYYIKCHHGTPLQGHMGVERTMDKIRRAGVTWYDMKDDVTTYIKSCGLCQKLRLRHRVNIQMATTAVESPFHTIAMDSIGPFEKDKDGNKHILVVIDAFTRWVELIPTTSTDAKTCAQALIDHLFLRYGLPIEIKSDNGPQYANEVICELLRLLKIKNHKTIPYHPAANGTVERTNQEVLRHLKCLVSSVGSRNDWSSLLPIVQWTINNSCHVALGTTPFAMLHGIHLLPRSDSLPEIIEQTAELPEIVPGLDNMRQYLAELDTSLIRLHRGAVKKQEREVKKRLADQPPPTTYKEGDYVLLTPLEKRNKFAAKYDGPYKVLECLAIHAYRLQSLVFAQKTLVVHPERMRPFLVPADVTLQDLQDLARIDNDEFVVDNIVGHTGTTRRNLRFQVRWQGYGPEDDTMEPLKNVYGNKHLEVYLDAHPTLREVVPALPE